MSKKKIEPVSESVEEAEKVNEEIALEPTAEELLAQKEEKYLRLAAEYDNFRKRTLAEKAALREIVVADTVVQFLNVLDNLERAALHAEGEVKAGLSMTIASFHGALTGLGVTEVEACTGVPFDANKMSAVGGEGDIVDAVLQKGYETDGRVLRYAVVTVKEAPAGDGGIAD